MARDAPRNCRTAKQPYTATARPACSATTASAMAQASRSSRSDRICMPTSRNSTTLMPKAAISQNPCRASTRDGSRRARISRPIRTPATTTAITAEPPTSSASSDVAKTATSEARTA